MLVKNTGFKPVCILGMVSWLHGGINIDVFARSFNDFYQHIPAFGASLRIIGNNGGCMLTEAASR